MILPEGVERITEARNERLHGYAWVIDVNNPDHAQLDIGKVEGSRGDHRMVGHYMGVVSRRYSTLSRDAWMSRVAATHLVKTGSPFCAVVEAFLVAIELSGNDWEQHYAAWDMIYKPLGEENLKEDICEG